MHSYLNRSKYQNNMSSIAMDNLMTWLIANAHDLDNLIFRKHLSRQ